MYRPLRSLRLYTTCLLGNTRLLPYVDVILYVLEKIKNRKKNKRFKKAHPQFSMPPASIVFSTCNHVDYERFYYSGIMHAKFLKSLIVQLSNGSHLNIGEWGCGPGRIVRHLTELFDPRSVTWYGTDNDNHAVEWCRSHIPNARFYHNGLLPPLPFDTGFFDIVFARSVFTHLSYPKQRVWIGELHRITRKGGYILFTTHGNRFTRNLLSHEKRVYNRDEMITHRWGKDGSKWFSVYHPPEFVRSVLLKEYTIEETYLHTHGRIFQQDLWIVKNN
jgi:SAM-dependent methyltransferase